MEKRLNSYDKEFLRMAMIKHEETFKQQVYELHRLYWEQKMLMKNMEIIKKRPKESNKEIWNSKNKKVGGHFIRKIEDYNDAQQIPRTNADLDLPDSNINVIDESEIELTLGPSCYYSNQRKNRMPEMPLNSDSGPSVSSSSTDHSNNMSKKGNIAIGTTVESGNGDLEEQLMKHKTLKQQQPWLYQVLSLNIT